MLPRPPLVVPAVLALAACAAPRPDRDDTGGEDTAPIPVGEVVAGRTCDPQHLLGAVELSRTNDQLDVYARVWDAPDPWLAAPALTTAYCAYYAYTPTDCGECADDEVCAVTGACVPERRVHADLQLTVAGATGTHTFTADGAAGYAYGTVADPGGPYDVVVAFASTTVTFPATDLATALDGVHVTTEGESDAPGALDVTWPPGDDASRVGTVVPINHHAGVDTFTRCDAPVTAGAFHADAAMIDPLAVVTGLEFQGVTHAFVAAAELDAGCVELRAGHHLYVFPE